MVTQAEKIPVPRDANFSGPIQGCSWKLSPKDQGAYLMERVNVEGRTELSQFDTAGTSRYYQYRTPKNAGQAHIRLHEATRGAGIEFQGGNLGRNLTPAQAFEELLRWG